MDGVPFVGAWNSDTYGGGPAKILGDVGEICGMLGSEFADGGGGG